MLKDRVVIVTGAGTGLGRTHAIGLAAQGASVVVNDIGTSWDSVEISDTSGDKEREKFPRTLPFEFNLREE